MIPKTVHIIGAGMAGLATAVRLARAGIKVRLYEAAQQAGGRCRSYLDSELGCRIDNGNHLLVSGNTAAMAYVTEIGAAHTFVSRDMAEFPFLDLKSGKRWSVRPTEGMLPWWLLVPSRRVGGTQVWHYLEALSLKRADDEATVRQALNGSTTLFERLWQPLTVAALNTEVEAASASLLWSVFAETFGKGGAALHPVIPRDGLSESLVDPALNLLEKYGGTIQFGSRLRKIELDAERVKALDFGKDWIELGQSEAVVLAVTAPVAVDLVPELRAPDEFRGIINAHFKLDIRQLGYAGEAHTFLGLINGTAEWIFIKPGIVSTTTSAADRLIDLPAEDLARQIWRDIAKAYDLNPDDLPPWRVVKEKRATFAATPEQLRRRPSSETKWSNLVLAGDWTDTGWPATIEGAIKSGFTAADRLLAR